MATQPGTVLLLAGGPGSRGDGYAPLVRELLALTGRPRPRVAYLGAATDDDRRFAGMMEKLVTSGGACEVRLAPVVGRAAGQGAARVVVEDADLVFLGGGDVELGMQRLAERDLPALLQRKHASGAPFLGVSAGAILLAQRWVRWPDPDDDASAEPFDCLALAPLLCDCHSEDDGWGELAALLRLSGEGATGHGIRAGAALRVEPGGDGAPALGVVDRLTWQGSELRVTPSGGRR